ncbi:hypothetical protein SRABI106_03736 [Rahnella aquatilis]|nr:hypothetical protein SRABI106_03736 [Rahnella aquatilis]
MRGDSADQRIVIQFGEPAAERNFAITHHTDPVGNRTYFRQFVRDEYHPDALPGEMTDLCKQAGGFRRCQRGGWFIKDQQPRIAHQPAQDFHQLLIGHFQGSGQGTQR